MFGNVAWFKPTASKLPIPSSLSGWLFYFLWIVAILTPSIVMFFFREQAQVWQGFTWLVLSGSAFGYDVFSVTKDIKKKSELDSLFFIGEDDSHVSTKNYDLNLRNSSHE